MINVGMGKKVIYTAGLLVLVHLSACSRVDSSVDVVPTTAAPEITTPVESIASATSEPTQSFEVDVPSTATPQVDRVVNPLVDEGVGPSYKEDIRPMFLGRCTQCHGLEVGRFDPNTYEGLLGVVTPGKPASSTIVQMMSFGHHAPGLKPNELEIVVDWILAGAMDN